MDNTCERFAEFLLAGPLGGGVLLEECRIAAFCEDPRDLFTMAQTLDDGIGVAGEAHIDETS
jgi:hypothetical protein